ncbi:DUF1028 domain-containing protein [Tropicimonas sp. IMCC34043]|uniref:DUF1028 domain-containing protein n=1 Tax=Tropicimonas sp. IMCC34043 TaxID=2248760 RepID=UPI000E241358|nr:DUF1028 domain-containing protein [Tropicimonas sp. IMCC34043]
MTFSVLARDPRTGALGGAAVTGNLCVGGWVLRGDPRVGLSASQGHLPSTLWGEDVLLRLADGVAPDEAVAQIVAADAGHASRQLSVLTREGAVAAHDGAANHPYTGHLSGPDWIVAGNWLGSRRVIEAAAGALTSGGEDLETRLIAALRAGIAAGSDRRGTLSAGLLMLAEDRPPLDLRVDWDPAPVDRLDRLLAMTRDPAYRAWLDALPTRREPERA